MEEEEVVEKTHVRSKWELVDYGNGSSDDEEEEEKEKEEEGSHNRDKTQAV